MWEKSQDHAFSARSMSQFTEPFDNFLVAVMYPIKSTYGDHCIVQFFEFRKMVIYFQGAIELM